MAQVTYKTAEVDPNIGPLTTDDALVYDTVNGWWTKGEVARTTGGKISTDAVPDLSGVYAPLYGPSNGSDDTVGLNAFLASNAGGIVRGTPGEAYRITAPLIVASGTTLDMTGCTVLLVTTNPSGSNMLNNEAVTAAATATDGAITAGQATLTSPTLAAVAQIGQTVNVAGALVGGYPLVANVTAVNTTSNTLTLSVAAGATVSGASVSLYTRDSNIVVRGGTWDRGTIGPVGGSTAAHSLMFRHVDGLTVRDMAVRSTSGKYMIAPGDCTNVLVENIAADVASAAFQANGPITNCTVRDITGTTTDDSIAFTPNDWTGYNDVCGPISGVLVENVNCVSASPGYNIVDLNCGSADTGLSHVTVRNISGSATAAGIRIGDTDSTHPQTTGGRMDDITVAGVNVTVPAGRPVVNIVAQDAGVINVDGVNIDDSGFTGYAVVHSPPAAGTIDRLTVSRCRLSVGAVQPFSTATLSTISQLTFRDIIAGTSQASLSYFLWCPGAVTRLVLDGVRWTAPQPWLIAVDTAASSIQQAVVRGCVFTATNGQGGVAYARVAGATLKQLAISDSVFTGGAWLVDVLTVTDLVLHGVTLASMYGVIRAEAGAALVVRGSGNTLPKGSGGVSVASGATVSVRTPDCPASTNVGGVPTAAAQSAAGTGATTTVAGTDQAGTVTLTPGTGATTGIQAIVTFIGTRPTAPVVSLTPTNAAAIAAGLYITGPTATTFTVAAANAPTGAMTFTYAVAT